MQKTVKIFGRVIALRQVILASIALVVIIAAGIYLIRFLFPAQPKATKAATSTTTTQEQIDTSILDNQEFKNLQDQGGSVSAPQSGRTNPFAPTTGQSSGTSGSAQ